MINMEYCVSGYRTTFLLVLVLLCVQNISGGPRQYILDGISEYNAIHWDKVEQKLDKPDRSPNVKHSHNGDNTLRFVPQSAPEDAGSLRWSWLNAHNGSDRSSEYSEADYYPQYEYEYTEDVDVSIFLSIFC